MVILIMPFFVSAQQARVDTIIIDSLLVSAKEQLLKEGYIQSNHLSKKALEVSQSIKDWDRWYEAFDILAYEYYYKGEFDSLKLQSQVYLEQLVSVSGDPFKIAKLHGWIGFASFYIGDNDAYLNSNLESARIYESLEKMDLATSAYINIGVCYTMKGDYKNAEQYLLQAEENAIAQNIHKKFYSIWSNLGILYWAQKSLDKSIEYYTKAKSIKPLDFDLLNNLAACYRDKHDLDTAHSYLDITKTLIKTKQDSFMYLTELAKLTKLEDKDASLKHIKDAITIGDSLQEFKRELAQSYLLMADLEFEAENLSNAKIGYFKALNLLDTSLFQQFNDDLNTIETNQASILNGPWVMESIYGLARTEMLNHQNSKTEAYKLFKKCFDVIDYIRLNFNSEESSLILGDYVRKIYQDAMQFACTNEEAQKNSRDQDFIMTCLERSRSFLLSSSITDLQAKKNAQIPDSLLNREKLLNKQITAHNIGTKTVDNSDYFEWVRELEELTNLYKTQYPKYYALTRSQTKFKLSEIRNAHLKKDQALVYHFEMPEIVFQIGITVDDFVIDQIPKNKELIHHCETYNRLLSQPSSSSRPEEKFKEYIRSAHYLFNTFLKDFLRNRTGIKELIFLPDGITHQIVFEALLEKKPIKDEISYGLPTLDYLLERFKISYAYSFDLNQSIFKEGKHQEFYSGFAPKFHSQIEADQRTCSLEGLFDLKYNESEVLEIQKTIGGKSYIGKEANKVNFLLSMEESKVVHLATHACVDDESADQHKIYFSEKVHLSSAEIYNISSGAELVVLSACETGLGQYHSGEGVLSLARTFAYAGVPSITMSLWSLPDKSTSDIMKNFYVHIKSGSTKHESLRQAKLNYIEQADPAKQHPYYWAALVMIGNTDPVVHNSSSILFWLIAFLLVGFLGMKIYKNKT